LRDNHAKKGEAYEQARLLSESVNDETMIMTDYVTQQNLRFYFGSHQTEEIVIPALCFYQHLPLPTYCESAMNGVCLLEVRDITPNHSVYGFDAYSHPSEWLAFLDWLFAFKYDSSGDVMSCRDIECRALCAGPVSILIKCTRRNVVGLKDLFGKLDQAIGSAANNRDQAFDDWLRRISAKKKRTIQEMAQSRAISCQ
jgi:hypothetical protein